MVFEICLFFYIFYEKKLDKLKTKCYSMIMVKERDNLNVQIGEKKMISNANMRDVEFDEIAKSKKTANEIIKNLGGESFLIENNAKNICFDQVGIEFLVKHNGNRKSLDNQMTHARPSHILITINKSFRSHRYKIKLEGFKKKRRVSINLFANVEPADLKNGIKNQLGILEEKERFKRISTKSKRSNLGNQFAKI